MRYVELPSHTDNGVIAHPQGTADAEMIGRDSCCTCPTPPVSTGAARHPDAGTRGAQYQDETPNTPAPGLRSSVGRWREAAKAAGKGADLDAMRALDRTWSSGSVLLGSVAAGGGRAARGRPGLVVGHSPTNEPPCSGLSAGSSRH
jgi:hypothetical protein